MRILLTLTLSGSVPALFLLFLRYYALRRMPSTVYYYAWLLVLLRFALPLPGMIPATAESSIPENSVYIETDLRNPEGQISGFLPSDTANGRIPADSFEAQKPVPPAEMTEAVKTEESAASAMTRVSVILRSPKIWLSVWAIGTALNLGWTVSAYLRFTIHLRHELYSPDRFTRALYASIPGRKPELFQSDMIRTPMMFGTFSPRIVLPARAYDGETLLNILRHELTHYRRFDTLYKWISVIILSAHWFNPLSWLIRKELNRACELSCDEMLLRSMTREEKQSYGNTLLSMAAASTLPPGVVATTFATEKRNLKERLVQIMNYKKSGARMLAAVLALVLLMGCGLAAGPQARAEKAEIVPGGMPDRVSVSSVDELLAAIAPNTTILLKAGEYDLSTAADYGQNSGSSWYRWETVWREDGETNAELVISGVNGLTLQGEGIDQTEIAAVPRYANVIRFQGCRDLTVSNLTAGHTTEPGFCSGGVLRLENCTNVDISFSGLYGCGTIGVDAVDTVGLSVTGCRIYECSYDAVSLRQCRSVRVEDCEIYSHGLRAGQGSVMALFTAAYSDDVVIYSNRIYDNASQFLLQLNYTKNAAFLSNEVRDNRFDAGVFQFEQYGATVDGCAFTDNGTIHSWVQSSGVYANDVTGKLLGPEDYETMTFRDVDPDVAVTPVPVSAAAEVRPGGEIVVTTIDEFLTAIGPDRTVILDGVLFDLSLASNYGSVGGEYYFWQQSYDGPQLVIQNVSGLSIRAKSDDPAATTLAAIPRYADVLRFRNCDDLFLGGFTAGHTKEPGSCSGGVLNFQNCNDIHVEEMRLYGCGILGIQASQCTSLNVVHTEIYECSQGAGQFFMTDGIVFDGCDIHDVPSPALGFTECGDKSWNGAAIAELNGMYDVDGNGNLVEYVFPHEEELEYHGGVEDLVNPFAEEPTYHYQAGMPQAVFAAAVQQAIVNDDWEALADRIRFPIQFFTDGYSFVIHDREEYMRMAQDEYFTSPSFEEIFGFHQRIADADLSVFASCAFGETCLDHMIAFACVGNNVTEDNLKITAISVVTPLWPGRSMSEDTEPAAQPYVLVTPQP